MKATVIAIFSLSLFCMSCQNSPKKAEHLVHSEHNHRHSESCGHEKVAHDGHIDYVHDGHKHYQHESHVDEHGPAAQKRDVASEENHPGKQCHDCEK